MHCSIVTVQMYDFNCHNCTGTVIEGPTNITYIPGVTPLPIELICSVTGAAAWRVNDTTYLLGDLANGRLLGHRRNVTNILVNSPVNNTEYICLSLTNDGSFGSDPAYIIIAGEYDKYVISMYLFVTCNT